MSALFHYRAMDPVDGFTGKLLDLAHALRLAQENSRVRFEASCDGSHWQAVCREDLELAGADNEHEEDHR